jgi:hypothetical protein
LTNGFYDIIRLLFVRQEEAEMPKGGKRRAAQTRRGGHVDKYAGLAARSQAELAAFNAQWEREHPVPEGTAVTTETPEDEEAA